MGAGSNETQSQRMTFQVWEVCTEERERNKQMITSNEDFGRIGKENGDGECSFHLGHGLDSEQFWEPTRTAKAEKLGRLRLAEESQVWRVVYSCREWNRSLMLEQDKEGRKLERAIPAVASQFYQYCNNSMAQ